MPRKSRIDAPGALHHIIARGIEGCEIFRDKADRNNFLDRLGGEASPPGWASKRGEVIARDNDYRLVER
jgi:hypothetical protein